ncbi:hypothetical protein P9112_003397 [Eukaryota sp. TZLM1-RC]
MTSCNLHKHLLNLCSYIQESLNQFQPCAEGYHQHQILQRLLVLLQQYQTGLTYAVTVADIHRHLTSELNRPNPSSQTHLPLFSFEKLPPKGEPVTFKFSLSKITHFITNPIPVTQSELPCFALVHPSSHLLETLDLDKFTLNSFGMVVKHGNVTFIYPNYLFLTASDLDMSTVRKWVITDDLIQYNAKISYISDTHLSNSVETWPNIRLRVGVQKEDHDDVIEENSVDFTTSSVASICFDGDWTCIRSLLKLNNQLFMHNFAYNAAGKSLHVTNQSICICATSSQSTKVKENMVVAGIITKITIPSENPPVYALKIENATAKIPKIWCQLISTSPEATSSIVSNLELGSSVVVYLKTLRGRNVIQECYNLSRCESLLRTEYFADKSLTAEEITSTIPDFFIVNGLVSAVEPGSIVKVLTNDDCTIHINIRSKILPNVGSKYSFLVSKVENKFYCFAFILKT